MTHEAKTVVERATVYIKQKVDTYLGPNAMFKVPEFPEWLASDLQAAGLLAPEWRPIAEHDGSTKEVLGRDAKGSIFKTWYFAPSSRTKDWLRCFDQKSWRPTHFMPLPAPPVKP